ncbi:MAG: HEAT repeat domain-containing protein [Candidatus Diapherotrites archaeon]|nr:HEAT repeat domain-containing protein [Candidatus Diapherotrites archaeon]
MPKPVMQKRPLIDPVKKEDLRTRINGTFIEAKGAIEEIPEEQHKDVFDLLSDGLDHPLGGVRERCVRMLRHIGGKGSVPLFISVLGNEKNEYSYKIKDLAVKGIIENPDPQAVDALIKQLAPDQPPWLVANAVDALKGIGDPRALPALEKVKKAHNPIASAGLGEAQNRLEDVKDLSEVILTIRDPRNRQEVLGRIDNIPQSVFPAPTTEGALEEADRILELRKLAMTLNDLQERLRTPDMKRVIAMTRERLFSKVYGDRI